MTPAGWVGPLCSVLAVVAGGLAAALAVHGPPPEPRPRRSREGDPWDGARAGSSPPRSDVPSLRLTTSSGVLLGVLFLVGGAAGPVLGPALAAAAAGLSWWLTGRLEPPAARRRRERLAAALPLCVDLLAACLAAGLSPGSAVELVTETVGAPLSEELAMLTARLRVGVDPSTVWRDLARHPQLGGLGRTVSRAVDSGASVADAMQRLAADLRREGRAQAETRARAVGVKAAVPLGVCLLPAFVLVGVVPVVAGSFSVLLPR